MVGAVARSRMLWDVLMQDALPLEVARAWIVEQKSACGLEEAPSTLRPMDVVELFGLVRTTRPATVIEVGTYIGVSTTTIARAMRRGHLYTCDSESDWLIASPNEVAIHQYRRQRSSEMFADLRAKGVVADLVYLDGRLAPTGETIEDLMALTNERTVFVMDDFIGIEKGVLNAIVLAGLKHKNLGLVLPRTQDSKTAILLSGNRIAMVVQ